MQSPYFKGIHWDEADFRMWPPFGPVRLLITCFTFLFSFPKMENLKVTPLDELSVPAYDESQDDVKKNAALWKSWHWVSPSNHLFDNDVVRSLGL